MIKEFQGRWRFLSNFYPCKIEHKGIIYPAVENFYVAMKVTDMQLIDGKYYTANDFRELCAKIVDPADVKHLGQKVKLRKDWDNKKLDFMKYGINEKFKDEYLASLLLMTGDQELIEGNWWHDNYWGFCSCKKCDNKGENNLGKILMEVRDKIRLSNNI